MKPAPALSAWSNAAQKGFLLVLHNSLWCFRPGVGGEEVSPAGGQPPMQLCALGDAGAGSSDTPLPACPQAAGDLSRAQGVSQITAFHLPPLQPFL